MHSLAVTNTCLLRPHQGDGGTRPPNDIISDSCFPERQVWPPLGISALSTLRVELASRGSTSSLRLGMGEREAGRRTAIQQCGSWERMWHRDFTN